MTSHWAADLIGKPWAAGATGPFSFDCRGLVRECIRRRGLPPLPDVEEAHGSDWRAISDDEAKPDDLITMQGPNGPHVGFMVEANGRLLVMHSNGHQGALGPEGIVELQELRQAVSNGYARFRFWRATSCS